MGVGGSRQPIRAESDAGFTLVEVIVAFGIAAIVLLALLGSTITAARASVEARVDQQSADLLTKTLEDTRSLDYGAVAMNTSDLSADSSIIKSTTPACPVAPCWTVPNGVGVEPLVTASTGSINPHVTTVTANANNVSFTLSRYITQPPGENTRRLTAVVSWNFGGQPHSRVASTIIANTRRGLPLPKFTIASVGGGVTAINPGGTLQLPFIVKNLGARDSFQLKVMSGGVAQSGWTFYPDANCTGSISLSPLPSPLDQHNGIYETGEVYPDSVTCYVAAKTSSTLGSFSAVVQGRSTKQPDASTALMTTDAVSVSVQEGVISVSPTPTPTYTTASPSSTATPTPSSTTPTPTPSSTSPTPTPSTTQICSSTTPTPTPSSGYTLHRFVLQNNPGGNTTTVAVNPMQRDDCTVQSADHAYSTEINSNTGRNLTSGGSTSGDGGATVAEWRWLPSTITDVSGTVVVQFTYLCSGTSANFQIAVGEWNQTKNNNQWTSQASNTSTQTCTGGWRTTNVSFTVATFTLQSKNGANAVPTNLDLRIAGPSGSGIRLNYDSPNAPSAIYVGTKP